VASKVGNKEARKVARMPEKKREPTKEVRLRLRSHLWLRKK